MTKTEFSKEQAVQLLFYNDIWEVLTLDSLILRIGFNYPKHSTMYEQSWKWCRFINLQESYKLEEKYNLQQFAKNKHKR